MKSFVQIFTITIVAVLFTTSVSAQSGDAKIDDKKYETIVMKVDGACGMCQSRIELAVYDLKGVKSVTWDLKSDDLTTVVKKGKVTKEQIAEAVADAGHSSELSKANPEAYNKLPDCCKYNDGVQKHGKGIDK